MSELTPKFTLRQLEIFLATIQHGSFAEASKHLFVTAGAVAVAVTDLEKALGMQLLIRRRAQGVRPTSAGIHLAEQGRQLLADANNLEYSLAGAEGNLRGPLAVGCYSTLSATVLPALIDGFSKKFPEVQLRITDAPLDQLTDQLLNGELDLVIGYKLHLPAGLEIETLYETEVHALLSPLHPAAKQEWVSLTDLASDPLILLELPPSGQHTMELLHQAGVTPQVAYRSHNFEFVRSMVARNLGYSLLIQKARLDRSYEGLPIVAKPIRPQLAQEWAVIVWPQGTKLTDRAQAFVDYAKKETVAPTIEEAPHQVVGGAPSLG